MKIDPSSTKDFSAQIAQSILDAIIEGRMLVDERLPSEAELSDQFNVSRPTIREALKRLAAQNLIRTQRGATGGAFVNHLTFEKAYDQHVTTSTLLLSMNDVSIVTACEARFALERACASLAAERREDRHLAIMRAEIARQTEEQLSNKTFCASDIAFHKALVDAVGNPVLSYQFAGTVEAMQSLMNAIAYTARARIRIIMTHQHIADALQRHDATGTDEALSDLQTYVLAFAKDQNTSRDTT